ncbi:MAG: hypothetical protein CM1200mP15_15120 [Dehalococcoidia bacterium]|nr:MAG: hypothetical protein CM1200mP15_15120 [Dehalococcoidia bacterium]
MSGDIEPALPIAAAVQLICDFMDVHGKYRREELAQMWKDLLYGGFGGPARGNKCWRRLHALPRSAMMRLSTRSIEPSKILESVRLLDNTCLTLCEGQYIDLTFQDQVMIRSSDYVEMVSKKSGSLSGCQLNWVR